MAGAMAAGIGGTIVKATGAEATISSPVSSITEARTLCGPSDSAARSGRLNFLSSGRTVVSPSSLSPSKNRKVAPGSAVPSRTLSSSASKVAPLVGRVNTGGAATVT